ncbi:NERD domain-containing protein [Frankia sp. QA3]|uniref:NERD domain-containing protein n=1 Tax=Frankia sp. QA3 TaxID=710111 RepID=UPI000269CF34|nr:NERD domain-containing protein [Frankia sp. QA3]EIV96305.1 DNA/RNA helicase, superfamily I [Frankia sp. QA3]
MSPGRSGVPVAAQPEPSAFGQAVLIGMEIDGVQRQIQHLTDLLRELRRSRRAWEAGARGERDVVRVLVGMDDAGWRVLPDRRWPGTRRANIDVLVVGPGGVFVVDVKNWREVRVDGGRLWRGDEDAEDELRKLTDQTAAVEQVLADAGLPPTEVVPLLVLVGRRGTEQLDRVQVTGELDLTRDLVRRGLRLEPAVVERVLACLDEACPPMQDAAVAASPTDPPRRVRPSRAPRTPPLAAPAQSGAPAPPAGRAPEVDGLFSRDELWRELVDAAAREPIETWMTWLHPMQARLVCRRSSGPARIRGAAGTGKTVVALHRAKYLAARGDRVLVTSLVRTLGPVNRALLARMAPEHVNRIEFTSVDALAVRHLERRGERARYQRGIAENCFWLAWGRVGLPSVLSRCGVEPGYWRDEIATVIKGRGLTGFEQYAELARVGRSMPLQPTHRRAVWELYEHYERLRTARGVLDRGDVLLLARDLAREHAGDEFDAVIVDEVQDLTCVGLQFLHALVGDRQDGLLVVGDGQQSVYPGGFTLAEAGVSVVGRSTVLARNYRNREAILRYAQQVVAEDSFDDLDVAGERGRREVEIDRPGGEVDEVAVAGPAEQVSALRADLVDAHDGRGVRYGDMALLTSTNEAVGSWQRLLARAGIPAVSLLEYDGTTSNAVKVGTYHRAKGLDFARVYIPDRNRFPRPRRATESDDAYRERAALERRQLYVALTRARDSLWVGLREPVGVGTGAGTGVGAGGGSPPR